MHNPADKGNFIGCFDSINMRKSIYWGVFLVFLGACSYGVLATIVKVAYNNGFNTLEITFSQFAIGWIALLVILLMTKNNSSPVGSNLQSKRKLMIAGTSMGLTSVLYYLCVKNIDVSIAIVLLMQSTWMGVIVEWLIERKTPSRQKIIAAIVVLIGTALSAKIFNSTYEELNGLGFLFGFLASISYTITVYASGKVALKMPALHRSFWMLSGGFVIIFIYGLFTFSGTFNTDILVSYGIPLALFGTVLPPILFAYGMPSAGTAAGTIVGAVELPISVIMAYFILNENVIPTQWIGILLILLAVVLMNYQKKSSIN
ncbi:EamA family transporter [Acidiluteibacter ferrifornacis]|nr:EamA family transporter [Acidiluteibacter ferrifornacis]